MKQLSIVLHTHMPYVEGFGTWPFGEEWLWEAIATSYLPLLDVLDAHPGKVTLSITPVLADQLEAPGALERCLTFLREIRPASHALDMRDDPSPALEYSAARYEAAADALERRGDLIAAFAPHVSWTSAATHAVLPLLATDAGVRLQLETGIASHRRRFGAWDGGFWLPECAHAPWLDELLEEAGVHVTCVEWPGPGPFRSQAGIVLVPLDRPAMDRVWHTSGYPSHDDYRDTHRLTPRAHQAWANAGTPYDPARGAERARAHAADFVASLEGLSVVAFDTELFGHFWHEGPIWLERVLELAELVPVPREASKAAPDMPPTSWGRGRDLRTWSTPSLAWTQRSAELAALGAAPSERALRELLALQSSDWAFLITEQTAGDYPSERAKAHYEAFLHAKEPETLRNLAPDLAGWAFVQP
jgi:1,4-alpha-glucan branching enzyme